jgi:hypothetical protein
MDINAVIEHIPAALAALAALLAGGWTFFKFIAPLTKSTADDEFIAEHGDAVEDALDKMEGE